MFRIRFHGRGGQGVKTASRILGTAFFIEGFDVQDAPRYGAERRGAPIFAYVRAHPSTIDERGIITYPDLVIVVDDSLLQMGDAVIRQGMRDHTVLMIHSASAAAEWADRLRLPQDRVMRVAAGGSNGQLRKTSPGVRCAGAAARVFGTIGRQAVEDAVRAELAKLPATLLDHNVSLALEAYDAAAPHEGVAVEGEKNPIDQLPRPTWIELPLDPARIASPTIHGVATSLANPTGFWRTLRPVLQAETCKQCYWLCTTFCPDNVMVPDDDGTPVIDYDHCKGCMLCLVQCPHHAIEAVVEATWQAEHAAGGAP